MYRKSNKLVKTIVMLLCVVVTAATLNQFAQLIQHLIKIKYDWKFELLMVVGQLFFQLPFIFNKAANEKWDYYFNMLEVSAMGSLMLIPLIALNQMIMLSPAINLSYFFIIVLMMFFDHKRRVGKLNMPPLISYTWVLYRFLILIYILI